MEEVLLEESISKVQGLSVGSTRVSQPGVGNESAQRGNGKG
jgi:hypothetical protein